MTNQQTIVICCCILSTSLIDLAYRENEKAPARKAAKEAREMAEFQNAVESVYSSIRFFEDDCQKYLKTGDAKAFTSDGPSWIYHLSSFCTKHPKAPLAASLSPFVNDVQAAVKAPTAETVKAALDRTVSLKKQLGLNP